jgi:GTP-binding protein Era
MILTNFHSGFVTILGRPNVGKSTLLNQVIGKKIAIMSDKPQTTRNTILGVYTTDETQIIFTDTPGIHKPIKELGRRMVDASYNAAKGVDAIFFMVSAIEKIGEGDRMIISHLKEMHMPIYLLINKIDLLKNPKEELPEIILSYMNEFKFEEVFPISAKERINIDELLENIIKFLPVGPKYYPEDMITDHPERFICAELIREKCLELTKEEVPHSIACVIDSMKKVEDRDDLVEIFATIFVERDSQKKIIIGKNGQMIKEIGTRARRDINSLLGSKSHLNLWVKVKKDWTNRPDYLRALGYDKDNF